jgi:hypothetical protein
MNGLSKPLLVIAMISGAPAVFACAESTIHVTQGMRYHGFTTRRPADILVYQPQAAPGDANRQIYAGLQRAGHHVTVIAQEPAAIDALSSRHFDVIIAPSIDMDALTAHLNSSARAPAQLPIVGAGDESAQAHFREYVRPSDSVEKYLKSIERTMRERGP